MILQAVEHGERRSQTARMLRICRILCAMGGPLVQCGRGAQRTRQPPSTFRRHSPQLGLLQRGCRPMPLRPSGAHCTRSRISAIWFRQRACRPPSSLSSRRCTSFGARGQPGEPRSAPAPALSELRRTIGQLTTTTIRDAQATRNSFFIDISSAAEAASVIMDNVTFTVWILHVRRGHMRFLDSMAATMAVSSGEQLS